MIGLILCWVTAVLDILGSFVMIVCQQAITKDFGFSDVRSRWSLIRRVSYSLVALALFFKGTYRFGHIYDMDLLESVPQIVIVLFIIFFPILRALKIITQDALEGNGTTHVLKGVVNGR